ncbi:Glucoamylase, intracellular sporulation-specific, partial [Rhizoclosmatium hyalinum]
MNDTAASKYYRNTAYSIHQAIQRDHWNTESYYLLSTVDWKGGPPGKTSLLDVSAILAAVHTRYIPILHQDIIAIDSGELLLTALQLAWRMQELYFINHVQRKSREYLKLMDNTRENLLSEEQLPIGPGIGRYTEDTYDGYRTDSLGNPWFLATNAFAELSFAVAYKWCLSRRIPTGRDQYLWMAVDWILKGGLMGHAEPPAFPKSAQSDITCLSHPLLFNAVIGNLTLAGDAFIRRIAKHVPQFPGEYGDTIGSMSEQFNRDTGFMQGAVELTWSHASFLSMVRQRNITKGMKGE